MHPDIENRESPHSSEHLLGESNVYVKSNFAQQDQLEKHFENEEPLEPPQGQKTETTAHQFFNEKPPDTQGPLDRWPSLFEILNRKTKSPVDLWSFYIYMRDTQRSIDYLDFWIDTVQHMTLCKAYVNGLNQSLVANERVRNAARVAQVAASKYNQSQDSFRPPPVGDSTIFPPSRSSFNNRNSNRDSGTDSNASRDSKVRSVTSSVLLNLLSEDRIREDASANRLSTFLRGETTFESDDPRVEAKFNDLHQKAKILAQQQNKTQMTEYDLNAFDRQPQKDETKRLSTINPQMVETLIQDELNDGKAFDKNHFVTRIMLRKSSENILKTYFSDDAEKKIVVPKEMIQRVLYALETEGRDDPEVFDETREYVFKAMEHEALPNFLRYNAMANITSYSAVIRLFIGCLVAFIAFWLAFSLIFVDYQPKPKRAVILVPFFIASYALLSSFYRVDPFLMFAGFAESRASYGGLVKIEEPFVKSLLRKRALIVLFYICILAACFTVLFALVPGYHLRH